MFAQGTVCLVILNVTLVKLCTSGKINSKVDFDVIKLCTFFKNWLFVHFFCRYLHLPDSTVWSTLLIQPEKLFQ